MSVTVRFAPSPTGLLHLGNARMALINWLFARSQGGRFILRIDDTDAERSKEEFVEAIKRDLVWLGLEWDQEEFQSRRLERFRMAAESLKAAGRLYPCYETQDELDFKRKLQLSRRQPPVYDRAALKLTGEERAKLEAEGKRPHWRFRLSGSRVGWNDLARHHDIVIDTASVSDPVLVREDGTFLYTLTSVVDDIEMGVSHVLRGEDHITNAAVQIDITQALGAKPPAYAHLSLLADKEGKGFSKRLGSMSLQALREEGFEAMALASYLARIGSNAAVEAETSLKALALDFSLDRFSHATPHVDPEDLARLNARLLHLLPFASVRERLELPLADEAFWNAVRPNLTMLADARLWWRICREKVAPALEDKDFTSQAASLLPPEPWGPESWSAFTQAVKAATGRSGKGLFHPLRLALTGLDQGPEMKLILPLIGRARAEARLCGETA